ncbi:MAG: DUF542 domain-containing protein [Chloroflexota bacterium]|nr:DUF542 domain-containing protein [Chloroflexota bacterium]
MTQSQKTHVEIVPTQSLNEIVTLVPETLPVLQRFGLDTCCGGSLPLQSAVAHHGLNLETVLAALRKVRRAG